MRRTVAMAFVLGLPVLALASLDARQSSAAPPTFRAGVDVVQIDVSVLDKNRTPVRDLTENDFTVLEDGKPRPIVAFTPVDLPSRTPARRRSRARRVDPRRGTRCLDERRA